MNEQEKIGIFIRSIREAKGMTQADFAKALKTSQSAVARMEKGGQNFTTTAIENISNILGRKIITVPESLDFKIEGGRKLYGQVTTNASKNGAMGLLSAALINSAPTVLHGIPKIEEVFRFIELLTSIGVKTEWIGANTLRYTPPKKLLLEKMDKAAAGRMRSSIMLMGALIHLEPSFSLPHAGGCKMGNRTISAHRHGLEALGVRIATKDDRYDVSAKKLHPSDIILYEASDTAAENLLIAASRIPGKTTIRFATSNYMVQEVCFFLEKLGVKIDGVGTSTLVVHGVKNIHVPLEYYNSEDPTEAMMFLSAAIVTHSELTIKRCPIDFIALEMLKLEKMGLKYKSGAEYFSKNGRTRLVDITVFPSKLEAPLDKIHAQPYPGINTDNLPFFVPIATQADGVTLIHDWMWENRAIYFTELNRLGAQVTLADPHRAYIHGPTKLKGAQIVCPPALRPAMIILIAMLGAEGTSVLRNIYSISRGYEEIAARLNAIGAKVEIIRD